MSFRAELLERAYRYALEHGVANLSLRPLASAIGSSPRVLLYLFGSKDGLVRALLARARAEELALLEELRSNPGSDLKDVVARIWRHHHALLSRRRPAAPSAAPSAPAPAPSATPR